MNLRTVFLAVCLTAVLLLFGPSAAVHAGRFSGLRSSDPHLTGPRDMNYDHMLIAGVRAGPVSLGGYVMDAVKHLGNPDKVARSTFRGPGYSSDEVYYFYKDECISFTWSDSGINPSIENGLRGINVTCSKWTTPDGLHVGSAMQEVNAHIGAYCPATRPDGSLIIVTKGGIWYEAKNRYSPVRLIRIMPIETSWEGMCKE